MKTIVITISRGAIAKNIFHTDIARILRQQPDLRVVCLTPAWEDPEFIAAFGGGNTIFAPLPRAKWGWLDTFLIGWAKGLVYNASTAMVDRYGVYSAKETSDLRYLLKKCFFLPLSKLRFLRTFLRFIDRQLTLDPAVVALFRQYAPDAVYVTNPSESDDAAILKAAQRLHVPSACMPKSWDNLSKLSFRGKADRLLAWSQFVKDEAMQFQDYAPSAITVTGIPHFDIYVRNEQRKTKHDFFADIGADPDRRLLVFGSEGQVSVHDADIVEAIIGCMEKNELVAPCQLFIRPYLSFPDDAKKFSRFAGRPHVIIDRWFHPNPSFYDHWDYSLAQFQFMANLLAHADLMVTSMSTLTLDASANHLPVINIAYDGKTPLPYAQSMTRYYDSEHYKAVVATGAPHVVHSDQELKDAINGYLRDRQQGAAGRQTLVERFCAPLDGHAGERVAQVLLGMLNAPRL